MLGAKLGGGRRKRGTASAAVALFASWLVLVCLAGIHGVAAGKSAMAPHPHQGKVKVGRYQRALRLTESLLVLLDTGVLYVQTHV